MSGFSFSATARCDKCGEYLESSEEECEHPEGEVEQQMFRCLTRSQERPQTIVVRATYEWKWYALAKEVGKGWLAYEYLGPRDSVRKDVGTTFYDTMMDVPSQSMALSAPNDVEEEVL